MSKFVALRLPDDLAVEMEMRRTARHQTVTAVLVEAIRLAWGEGMLRPERKDGGKSVSQICGKRWWEDGECWECLMEIGHKNPKHGCNGMFRKVEG